MRVGDYRLIYGVNVQAREVVIHHVRHRREVYRSLQDQENVNSSPKTGITFCSYSGCRAKSAFYFAKSPEFADRPSGTPSFPSIAQGHSPCIVPTRCEPSPAAVPITILRPSSSFVLQLHPTAQSNPHTRHVRFDGTAAFSTHVG